MGGSSCRIPASYRGLSLRLDLRRARPQFRTLCPYGADDVVDGICRLVAIHRGTARIHESAPGLVLILTIAVVNLRHVLYSASLAPYLSSLSTRWKVLLSYLLTDEAYAPSVIHYEKQGITPYGHWFLLGAGFSLWFIWQTGTAIGIFLGSAIPKSWSLDFALPLTFIAMVMPVLKNRPSILAALSAGIVALFAYSLPYKLGLILAALIGIAVGTLLENQQSPKETL